MDKINHRGQRVGILIDTQNLYHAAKNIHSSRVNFNNIVLDCVAGRDLIRAIAYVINTDSNIEQGFFEALFKMGIEAKIKDIQVFSSGTKKADWDVGLAIDAIKLAPKLDTIILATGDGDFVHLVEYLQITFGCKVEIVAFGKSSSSMLKETADSFRDLSENHQRYLIQNTQNFKKKPKKNKSTKNSQIQQVYKINQDINNL